jgi:MGT family glycosyltransferase
MLTNCCRRNSVFTPSLSPSISSASCPDRRVVAILLLPELGAFNGSFVVARRLEEYGYAVTYFGPSNFEEHVRQQGFSYLIIELEKASYQPDNGIRWLAWRRSYLAALDEYHGTLSVIRRWAEINQPTFALVDPLMWRVSPPLLQLCVPIVNLNTTLASKFNIAAPPVFSHIVADGMNNWRSTARYLFAWCSCLLRAWYALLKDDLRLISVYGPFKHHLHRAQSLIMRAGGKLTWSEYGPRILAPELVMAPQEFDFRYATKPNRIYLGSCVDERRHEGDFDWSTIDKTRKLVYCSLGTYSHLYLHSELLFRTVVAALKPDVGWQAVIQVGNTIDPKDFGPLPSHLLVRKVVPQLQLLQHADAFITHGGFSSVREAIYYGVPMLVFPCRFDQPGNAARIVHHHIGLRADISKVDATQLLTMLKQTQEDDFRQAVGQMQKIFRRDSSAHDGMSLIKELFERKLTRQAS